MKAMVLYYSKTGHTQKMAEIIAQGMERVQGVQAKACSIDDLDEAWAAESKCIVLGSPIYFASVSSSPGSKGHARNASSPASWAEPSRRWIISTAAANWASASSSTT